MKASIGKRSIDFQNVTTCFIATFALIVLVLPSLGAASITRSGWESQQSGTTDDLFGVAFVDFDVGTAVGGAWDHARILRTINGGQTWTQSREKDQGPTPSGLLGVSFYNKDVGMAVGYYGTIIYTSNGGEWWNTVDLPHMNTYFGCDMYNERIGFAVGVTNTFVPLVTRTTDGWNTWDHVAFYISHDNTYYDADLTDVQFVSPTVGFATARVVYGQGAIVRSMDGGETWKVVYWSSYSNLLGITFVSAQIGYAVGNYGLIVKTMDGGNHWQVLPSGVGTNFRGMSFASKYVGTVVGEHGVILRTTNGGLSWVRQTSNTQNTLNDVFFVDEKTGYVVGDQGLILHTSSGGALYQVSTAAVR
jgi:photosystem II stability/assembly factor-like uncharacterized protein